MSQGRLVIMRGLPGSGKSTKAKSLLCGVSGVIRSTDDFFIGVDGIYRFDPKRIGEAHHWNQERVKSAMVDRWPLVIVDNTNVQAWEAAPYVRAALDAGYSVEFCQADTPWAFDVDTLAQKNAHGVPREAIARMRGRWEHDLTVEKCLAAKAPF